MIAFLNGRLDSIDESFVYIDCGGVGYGVMMPSLDIMEIGNVGESIKVYTHFHVTENEMSLYGFTSKKSKELFEMLISVSGIGPKAGIAILSELSADELMNALITGDVKAICAAKGVGKKIAERAILELGNKLDASELVNVNSPRKESAFDSDVIMALEALGYSKTESREALNNVDYVEGMTEEDLLKECLKVMI